MGQEDDNSWSLQYHILALLAFILTPQWFTACLWETFNGIVTCTYFSPMTSSSQNFVLLFTMNFHTKPFGFCTELKLMIVAPFLTYLWDSLCNMPRLRTGSVCFVALWSVHAVYVRLVIAHNWSFCLWQQHAINLFVQCGLCKMGYTRSLMDCCSATVRIGVDFTQCAAMSWDGWVYVEIILRC